MCVEPPSADGLEHRRRELVGGASVDTVNFTVSAQRSLIRIVLAF